MKNTRFNILTLCCVIFLTACSDSDPVEPTQDYSDILDNTGENVILRTYEDLANAADALKAATQLLESDPTEANLTDAKTAWVVARSPWEQSEGFLFGPVDQEGLDPSLDSWPVNVTDLNNVLASSNDLTVEFLAQQEGTLKGFHTIEFLLWGENGNKAVADFTQREFEYLAAASGALADDTNELYDLWKPSGGNFIASVTEAGEGSVVYISQKSALEEITNALIIIADEVGNGKINDPFSQQDLTLEESRFSANSKADFADNMRSIRNIYTGYYSTHGNGNSIAQIIRGENESLDAMVKQQIDAAITAIEDIQGTFSDAIFNNASEVQAAQTAVRDLQQTLEEEVLPIISNL